MLSLLIAAAFVWLLHRGALPLVPSRESFARVNPWGVVLHLVIWSGVHFIRAIRWYWLLSAVQPVPLGTVIRSAFIGMMAIVVVPFRMGEVVRPLLVQRDAKVDAWAATGTVGAERIIDGLAVSAVLLGSLALARPVEPLPDHIGDLAVPVRLVPGAALTTALVFLTASGLMFLFYWRRHWAERFTLAVLGVVSHTLAQWVSSRVAKVAEGLGFLRQPRSAFLFVTSTAIYWLLNGLSWFVLARASGLSELSFVQAFATMGVLAVGILVPNAPGFFGAFQLAVYAGLAMYVSRADVQGAGATYVFLTYINQVGLTLTFGGAAALVRAASKRRSLAGGAAP